MVDHDQRFKSLLKAFFAEFFQMFFPAWADRFDFSRAAPPPSRPAGLTHRAVFAGGTGRDRLGRL